MGNRFTHLCLVSEKNGILTSSVDPDKMLYNVGTCQDLHYLLPLDWGSLNFIYYFGQVQFVLEIYNYYFTNMLFMPDFPPNIPPTFNFCKQNGQAKWVVLVTMGVTGFNKA